MSSKRGSGSPFCRTQARRSAARFSSILPVHEVVRSSVVSNGSFDDAIFYVVRPPTMALAARAKSREPEMLVMARLDAPEQAVDIERTFRSFGSPSPEVVHVGYPFLGPLRRVVSGSHRFKVFADSWALPVLSVPWLRLSGVELIESNDPIAVARLL
jgi:hypothetical protein